MAEILTEKLLDELLFTDKIEDYLEKDDLNDNRSLSEYIDVLLSEKGLKKSTVINDSKLNTTFAYQIMDGSRNATRDKIIQLAFGMGLTLKETQRLLKHGGVNELYPKEKRDAIIIHCIDKGCSLDETDDALFKFEQETICQG